MVSAIRYARRYLNYGEKCSNDDVESNEDKNGFGFAVLKATLDALPKRYQIQSPNDGLRRCEGLGMGSNMLTYGYAWMKDKVDWCHELELD